MSLENVSSEVNKVLPILPTHVTKRQTCWHFTNAGSGRKLKLIHAKEGRISVLFRPNANMTNKTQTYKKRTHARTHIHHTQSNATNFVSSRKINWRLLCNHDAKLLAKYQEHDTVSRQSVLEFREGKYVLYSCVCVCPLHDDTNVYLYVIAGYCIRVNADVSVSSEEVSCSSRRSTGDSPSPNLPGS